GAVKEGPRKGRRCSQVLAGSLWASYQAGPGWNEELWTATGRTDGVSAEDNGAYPALCRRSAEAALAHPRAGREDRSLGGLGSQDRRTGNEAGRDCPAD